MYFIIQGAPQPKERARMGKHGFYTPSKTSEYEELAGWVAKKHFQTPLAGPLAVTLDFYLSITQSWPLKRKKEAEAGIIRPCARPDADNLSKLILDSLIGIAYIDDAQVVDLHSRKFYGQPRTEVTIVCL